MMAPPPHRTIEIVDHDPGWRSRFTDERDRLWTALREEGVDNAVVAIEQIGSTAVPGLAAKPVIDIMVGLRRFPAPDALIKAFTALGYVHRGESGFVWRHYFTDAPPGHPRTRHIHAVEHGSWFWREHLRFRDHLRRHPEDAAAYAEVKRDLARQHPDDVIAYTEGKTAFVHAVLRRARAAAGDGPVHGAAAAGFDAAADVYENARPGYPREAVDHLAARLGLAAGRHVVDLGAGTGKLTRLLEPTGARITAVEPVAEMRRALREATSGVDVVEGTAEEMPLAMGAADAVVAGQAFHWFDAPAALSEAHRVLIDGGGVGLVWNVRDTSVDWMARWTKILAPVAGSTPRERGSRWREVVEVTSSFTDPVTVTFPNPHVVPRGLVVDRVASTSFVAALDDERRRELLDEFTTMLDTHPQTRDRGEITVPYRTEVHTFHRIP